ncbi:hypothetical protein [Candidatus Pantoea communis]|nr:hypothetical protein [Pantoea communis]
MNENYQKSSAYREADLWESMRNQNDRNYRRVLKKQRAKAAKRNGAK